MIQQLIEFYNFSEVIITEQAKKIDKYHAMYGCLLCPAFLNEETLMNQT